MTIFGYKLNWTDYLAVVTAVLVGAAMYQGGYYIPVWVYAVPAGLFGIDKFIRVGSAVFGGYRQFRRILFLFVASVAAVFAVYSIAVTGGTLGRNHAIAAVVGVLVAFVVFDVIEKALTGRFVGAAVSRNASSLDAVKMSYGDMPGEISRIDGDIV